MNHIILTALGLAAMLPGILAAPTPTSSASQTQTINPSFPTITDTENTGDIPGGVGSVASGPTAGASSSNGGAYSLSTGAVVGIAVGIILVIAIISEPTPLPRRIGTGMLTICKVPLWLLWFIAKRRQWTIRETLTRASRRLTGRKAPPPTPKAPTGRRNTSLYVHRGDREKTPSTKGSDRSRSVSPEEDEEAAAAARAARAAKAAKRGTMVFQSAPAKASRSANVAQAM
jgi:hypothetical protein